VVGWRGASRRGRALAGALVPALLLACSTAASVAAAAASQLALMPLPTTVLGAAVSGLTLAPDSGVVTNGQAASNANAPTTAATLAGLGRVSGYQLDFGGDAPTGAPISQVETAVELYRSAAGAARGLAFWRKNELDVSVARQLGFSVSLSLFAASGLGGGSFGDDGTLSVKGAPPFQGADVYFRVGRLVGSATVGGHGLNMLRSLALTEARSLRQRISAVLAGRVSGRPAVLPGKVRAGPPPGGPGLEPLALKPTDFVAAKLKSQGYTVDTFLNPISEYRRTMVPAGTIASFQEQVALFRDATQAAYELGVLRALFTTQAGLNASGLNGKDSTSFKPRSVPVTAGDESFAAIGLDHTKSGASAYLGYVVVRLGRTLEILVIANPASRPIPASALTALAAAAATRATRGLHPPFVA
jgi:hypothetical protein